jgi:hypothetical protein
MLVSKSIREDGQEIEHHASSGSFSVNIGRSVFYSLAEIIGDGYNITELKWRSYTNRDYVPSLITQILGEIPCFFHHLDPRYNKQTS